MSSGGQAYCRGPPPALSIRVGPKDALEVGPTCGGDGCPLRRTTSVPGLEGVGRGPGDPIGMKNAI